MISFPDLRGHAAGLPGDEKPLSHAFLVSHFTFKTYMSSNLTALTVCVCHWEETQIFIKEQKKTNALYDECALVIQFLFFQQAYLLKHIQKHSLEVSKPPKTEIKPMNCRFS